jgi:hypothetical protein
MAPNPAISIRRAQAADIPDLASMGVEALKHDPVYAHFCPHRFTYPAQYRTFLLQELRTRMVAPGQAVMVAEQELDDGSKELVGYACWIREGSSSAIARWGADSMAKSR